jgi:hypothetical protein
MALELLERKLEKQGVAWLGGQLGVCVERATAGRLL